MTGDDWKDCVMRAIAEQEGGLVIRADLIRASFRVAREYYGIEFAKLVKSVRTSIEWAMGSCLEHGYITKGQGNTLTLRAKYAEPDL